MAATNVNERHLELWPEGEVDARRGYSRDCVSMARAARDGTAVVRLWTRPEAAIALGRFQRRPLDAPSNLERRLTGGRYVALGPQVLGLTMILPSVAWLATGGPALRPDQVLNRALRPLLATLRDQGVDAFYPGRDLITAGEQPFAHASFTILGDGVVIVEAHLDVGGAWREAGQLLAELDPEGVAGADLEFWANSVGAAELSSTLPALPALPAAIEVEAWAPLLARSLAEEASCDVDVQQGGSADSGAALVASDEAWGAFLAERGPVPEGAVCAVSMAMLGVVEASAMLDGDRLRDLCVAGELIAPHHTLDDLAAALEGVAHRGPYIRRALVQVLGRPRSFVLGISDLDALLERLA